MLDTNKVLYQIVSSKLVLTVSFCLKWLRWHPRGHIVLAGSEDCSLWMWNTDKGAYLNMFSGHNLNVTCGDFTPDGIKHKLLPNLLYGLSY